MTSTVFDLVGRHAIEKGQPWQKYFTRYAGPAKTPVDLTGYGARLDILDAFTGQLLHQLSSDGGGITIDPVVGAVRIDLPGSVSAAWQASHLRYRFYFILAGAEQLFLRGRLALLDLDT